MVTVFLSHSVHAISSGRATLVNPAHTVGLHY